MTDSLRELTMSAVVTCYKDEQAILPMHRRLSQVLSSLGVKYETIFVNDGSPDAADPVLRELTTADNQVLAIEHSRNFGSQKAFISVPIELLGYAGATMTALSSLVYQWVDALLHPEVPHGISIIIVLVAFFGSIQLLAVATVGEYVIKILEEAKRRPRFIREAIQYGGERFTTPAQIDGFPRGRLLDSPLLRSPNIQSPEVSGKSDGT